MDDYGHAIIIRNSTTKSTRELALEWWNNIGFGKIPEREKMIKDTYVLKYYQDRALHSLTGREIEDIWRQENDMLSIKQQQLIDKSLEGLSKEPRVDFEMLKKTISFNVDSPKLNEYFTKEELVNLQLFFKLLSTKITFATVAAMELNKLNK